MEISYTDGTKNRLNHLKLKQFESQRFTGHSAKYWHLLALLILLYWHSVNKEFVHAFVNKVHEKYSYVILQLSKVYGVKNGYENCFWYQEWEFMISENDFFDTKNSILWFKKSFSDI